MTQQGHDDLRGRPLPVQVFVYYRVTDAMAATSALPAALAGLMAEHTGLTFECLERHDDKGVTLLEVYRHTDGVSAALQASIEAVLQPVLAPWLVGPRRIERFTRCA